MRHKCNINISSLKWFFPYIRVVIRCLNKPDNKHNKIIALSKSSTFTQASPNRWLFYWRYWHVVANRILASSSTGIVVASQFVSVLHIYWLTNFSQASFGDVRSRMIWYNTSSIHIDKSCMRPYPSSSSNQFLTCLLVSPRETPFENLIVPTCP